MARSTDHIGNPELKALYEDVWDEAYEVLTERGPKLLKTAEDRLAVLECMAESCRAILEDLDEHGEDNEALYDDNGYDHFDAEQEKLEKRIQAEREAGATSDVFERWKKAEDDDPVMDDFVEDIMGTKGRKLVQALAAAHEDDAEGFVAVLGKIGELADPGEFADNVSGYVQNGLIAHYQSEDFDGACMIVQGYASLIEGGFRHGEYHFEAVATSVSIAQLSGDDDTANAVFGKLVPENPDDIDHARLAFNLACLAAIRNEKAKLIQFTALAIKLGKTPDQFQDDSDFDNFRDDADFNALLA